MAVVAIMSGLLGWGLGATVAASAVTYYGPDETYGTYRGWDYNAQNKISNDTRPGRATVTISTLHGYFAPPLYMGVRPRMWNATTGNLCAQSTDWIYNGTAAPIHEAYVPKASTCNAYNSYYSQGNVRMLQSDNTYVTKTPGATDLLVLP